LLYAAVLAMTMVPLLSGASLTIPSAGSEIDVPEPVEACLSCHALEPGDEALEGPSLWRVVGRPVASLPGFEYSAALEALGGTWTRERLDRFLASPQAFAPGTRMELGGVRNAADRKVVLDFLETLTASDGSTSPAAAVPAAPARTE
jgi:cytochrome c